MAIPTAIPSVLDAEELLHLAILDSQAGRHDAAISKLKQAVDQAPGNAKVHYLLAAEHAEIGLYERAIEGMTKAVTLDPDLDTARLQLGLLYFTQGRTQEAQSAWARLDKLGPDDSLYLFKSALLKLDAGATDEAVPLLERAAQNVRANPALAKDIQRTLSNIKQRLSLVGTDPKVAAGGQVSLLLATKYKESGNDER